MRQAFMQRLAANLGSLPNPDKWIFIIGCYNSGTTLLAQLLKRHSCIKYLPGEGVAFTDGLQRPEEFGWPRLWIKCRNQMQVNTDKPDELASRIKKQWGWASAGSGSCMLEKSIANVTRLDFLNEYFQPAYFIHITRNGYAVAEGIQRKTSPARWNNRQYRDKYPITLCAEQWAATEALIEAKKDQLGHYHALSYEDIAVSPAATMQQAVEFLGLPWEDQILDPEVEVHGKSGPIVNMNAASLERLNDDDLEKIKTVAGDLLLRHGYLAEC